MANKFRGITWNNARFGAKIRVRRSIDMAELGDFGNITDNSEQTMVALHQQHVGTQTYAVLQVNTVT